MEIKRFISALSAMAIGATSLAIPSAITSVKAADSEATVFPYTIEAEDMQDVEKVWTSIYETETPGYSGEGFVYMTGTKYSFEVTVEEAGMYEISARLVQILTKDESRRESLQVNGTEYSFYAPYTSTWTDCSLGQFRLNKGTNTIMFTMNYGYAAYDTITVDHATYPDISEASGDTCDKNATSETKSLMKYLKSVYGTNIISGQQEIYGGGNSVSTTIRYDSSTNTCVDQDGNTYTFDESEKDTADDGSTFVWHCYGADGQEYTYDSSSRGYKYNDYNYDINYIYDLTGEYPAIHGFDFGSYCPCYAWDDGVAKRMIDWAKNKNGIVTASWHINVPTTMADYTLGEPLDFSKTTYSNKTDFVTANCMVEGTTEYEYFNLCVENLAAEIQKLQDAGVPLIFRPFHEAEGNPSTTSDPTDGSGAWFWWSKEGTTVYKNLWKYLYNKLTVEYGLHNIIWEENLYAWSDSSAEWYVGDDYVDIVGYDKYNTQYNRHDGNTSGPNLDSESSIFWSLNKYVDSKKMVSMPENDSVPSLENLQIENAKWLYFCPWYDSADAHFVTGDNYQDKDEFTKLYQSDYCITLDELPADLYGDSSSEEETKATTATEPATTEEATIAEETTSPIEETTAVATEAVETTTTVVGTTEAVEETTKKVVDSDVLYGDVNCDGTVSISDVVLLNKSLVDAATLSDIGKVCANAYQTSDDTTTVDSKDSLAILKVLVNSIKQEDLPVSSY